MQRIRSRLTYANVIATILAFVVLGGGAYAAFRLPRNSVRSKNIVNGQVKGADVKEASLGRVPRAGDAQTVGRIPPGQIGGVGITNGGTRGSCRDDEHDGSICGSVTLYLPRPGRVLVTVTGEVSTGTGFDDASGIDYLIDNPNLVAGECVLEDNGLHFGSAGDSAPLITGLRDTEFNPGNFSRAEVSYEPLSAGTHKFTVNCLEEDGDITWDNLFITAVRLGRASPLPPP
jgi:hypothetical protein